MKLPPTTDMSIAPVSIMEIAHHKGDSTNNFRKVDQEYDYGMGSKWAGLVSEARELAARFNKDMTGGQDLLGTSLNMNLDENEHLGGEDIGVDDEDDEEDDEEGNDVADESAANVLKNVAPDVLSAGGTVNAPPPAFSNDFPFTNDLGDSDSEEDDDEADGEDDENKMSVTPLNPFDIHMNRWSSDGSSDSEDEDDVSNDDPSQSNSLQTLLQCKVCGKKYSKLFNLQRHEAAHEGRSLFRCRTCNTIFPSRELREKVRLFFFKHFLFTNCRHGFHLFSF